MKPMPEERDKTTEEPQVLDLVAPWNLPLALDLGDREREAVAATLTPVPFATLMPVPTAEPTGEPTSEPTAEPS